MSRLDDELAKLEASDPKVAAASRKLDDTIRAIGSGSYRIRRVRSSVVHVTRNRHNTRPSEQHGRAVRVLLASKVECACGVILESSDERPVLVLGVGAEPTCRGCREHA